MNILVFDTETTSLPLFSEPSEHPGQPHMVDVAALLYSAEGELIESFEAIIKPDGWAIPDDTVAIHGISTQMALKEGIPEVEALEGFLAVSAKADLRVAHNLQFDERIIRIALLRYKGAEAAEQFKAGSGYCTCQGSRSMLKLPRNKMPKLAEAYRFFTGEEIVGAHRARPDAEACARVYFELHKRLNAEFGRATKELVAMVRDGESKDE